MRVIFVKKKHVLPMIVGMLLLIFTVIVLSNFQGICRMFFGVSADVSLAGVEIGGMLPDELAKLVENMATKINREAHDAWYFGETGEIIPEKSGKTVSVAATVRRACEAAEGEQLDLIVEEIAPQKTAAFYKPIYHGVSGNNRVALAINVAWGEEFLPQMLETLRKENVKATFFFVGTWVNKFPEMVREIAAAGHEIANHGSYHGHPTKISRENLRQMISENDVLLRSLVGKKAVKLFAPPSGEVNEQVAIVAGELGFKTILWSVDTIDWKNPGPEALQQRVLSKIDDGGIILMHPTISTANSLSELIQKLREKKLNPTTVGAVL